MLYVDDSNATTPQSAVAGARGRAAAGRRARGREAEGRGRRRPLVEALAARARAVVTMGTSGPDARPRVCRAACTLADGGPDMASAVRAAAALARPGDAVLLSPGFSSLDQYPSFAVRGDRFRAAVLALAVTRRRRRGRPRRW